ncbi:hypothetical protein ACFL1Y_01130 [Patescibacteria group bacterium]
MNYRGIKCKIIILKTRLSGEVKFLHKLNRRPYGWILLLFKLLLIKYINVSGSRVVARDDKKGARDDNVFIIANLFV